MEVLKIPRVVQLFFCQIQNKGVMKSVFTSLPPPSSRGTQSV